MQRMIRVGAVVVAAIFSVSAHADWSEGQSNKEYTDCLGGCRVNQNIPGQHSKCPTYCSCLVTNNRFQPPVSGPCSDAPM